jgi:phosphatidylglycerophosphatase A
VTLFARVIGTWFFLGLVPKGPGTAGSLAALAIAWFLHVYAGVPAVGFALCAALLLAPAIWAAGRVAQDTGLKDPQIVVVDEVVGQWITVAGAATLTWKSWLAAFLLFRAFDIWKPPPVRQLERVPGGAGIVLDDAMAGIYAALVLYAAQWFNSISAFLYGIS